MSRPQANGASLPPEVDIAIVTILPEEYEAVRRRLKNVQRDPGTKDQPNQYAWVVGEIDAAQGGTYQVALAMTLHPGNASGSLGTSKTIARWSPRYVLLVGIAGGLPREQLGLGDVVVSKQIVSYEYGKVEHNAFKPRPDFIYQIDAPLLRNALAHSLGEVNWRSDLGRRPGTDRGKSKIIVGMVASGEKVIDDRTADFFAAVEGLYPKLVAVEMEGAGAAAAIQEARDEGQTVGFLMIRGISDMPPGKQTRSRKPARRAKHDAPVVSDRDQWKSYAANAAASFAVSFIAQAWPLPPRSRDSENALSEIHAATAQPNSVSASRSTVKAEANMSVPDDKVAQYLKTYLEPAPVQEPDASGTDPQLSTIMMTIIDRIQQSDGGVILDVGCGKGTLLQRLLQDVDFGKKSNWVYVGVDIDENLDEVQRVVRNAQIGRRVELLNLDSFYKIWPRIGAPQLAFCRNVFHELTIAQTSQLLRHLAQNLTDTDTLICQDLMNFPQGERHNACWFPDEFDVCVKEHGFHGSTVLSFASKSGARWFNLVAKGSSVGVPPISPEDSIASVQMSRHRQWTIWSNIDKTAHDQDANWSRVVSIIDLDLQLAALTRQLRDAGAFIDLDGALERRLRGREIAKTVEAFLVSDRLEKRSVAERLRLRERGKELNELEEFLRGDTRLAAVVGGGGTGKTALVEHLLATRSYEKSPVVVDAKQTTDLWSFVERIFAQVGLRLVPERLSVLRNLSWQALEVPLRQFANHFSSRIIWFVDNLDALLDSNGTIQDRDLSRAISTLVQATNAKMLVALRGTHLPEDLMRASGTLNPLVTQLRRFATEQAVVNVLDDHFDRSRAGLASYPPRLMQAIDRHPLAATLAGEILRKHGPQVLSDERLFLELEQRLYRELWGRLVDDQSLAAIQMAGEVRIPVPRQMIEDLSSRIAVSAGLLSTALYVVEDRRWSELVASLAVFRRRRIESAADEAEDKATHKSIADHYLSVYHHDDDPKWMRESYFHRMLAGGADTRLQLGEYYHRELVASANYCFLTLHDYGLALELYNAAAKNGELPEEAQMHRASCRVRKGERPSGDAEFEALIGRYPRNIGLRTSYVDALLFLRDFTTAKQKLEKLELDPDRSDWIAGQWGRTWLGLNAYKLAESMFRKQLALKPLADPKVFINLARALQYQGAATEALKVLDAGQALHRGDVQIAMARGAALERLRRDDDALAILESLFEARPDRSMVALPMIKISSRRGEAFRARQIFNRAKQHASDHDDNVLLTAEAEVLKAEGRHEAAVQLLRAQPMKDQHLLGMLLECWFHYAQSRTTPSERVRIAREALAENIPAELRVNIPLVVNRARLAALVGDRVLFDGLLTEIGRSRAEAFESRSLERLWNSLNAPDAG